MGLLLSDPTDSPESGGESSQRYAARMVYLTEEDEGTLFGSPALDPMGKTLKPPVLFMSRRQARADSALCAVRGISVILVRGASCSPYYDTTTRLYYVLTDCSTYNMLFTLMSVVSAVHLVRYVVLDSRYYLPSSDRFRERSMLSSTTSAVCLEWCFDDSRFELRGVAFESGHGRLLSRGFAGE